MVEGALGVSGGAGFTGEGDKQDVMIVGWWE
jgi:hypothetical protein